MADLIGADVRDLLTAIHDALHVPAPASPEYQAAQDWLLAHRAAAVQGVIAAILDNIGQSSLETHARAARRVLAESHPVTYPVRDDRAPAPVRVCRLCGCTDADPCPAGCRRVDDPLRQGELCSSHTVEARDLEPGQVVRYAGWHGGLRVRIDRVLALEAGRVSVVYQDSTAFYPLVEVHVPGDLRVLLEGGAR